MTDTPPTAPESPTPGPAEADPPRSTPLWRRWPWIAGAVAVLLVGGTVALTVVLANREDPGVASCRLAAKLRAEHARETKQQSKQILDGLLDSDHADLREVGEKMKALAIVHNDMFAGRPTTTDLHNDSVAGIRLASEHNAACRRHGVPIIPT
jgi:hypothetical protein